MPDPIKMDGASEVGIAACHGDIPRLASLVHATPSVLHDLDGVGRTPLHWAVVSGQTHMVKYLIGHWSADSLLSVQDMSGNTPLHLFRGPASILQLLHMGGARRPPELANAEGKLPLQVIAEFNGFTVADASTATESLLNELTVAGEWGRDTVARFSFLRHSPARRPPARVRPPFWANQLSTRDVIMCCVPHAYTLALCMLPFFSVLVLASVGLLVMIVGLFAVDDPRVTLGRLVAPPRQALHVLLALILLLVLQNTLALPTELMRRPWWALAHVLLQVITLGAYVGVVTLDPGFVRTLSTLPLAH